MLEIRDVIKSFGDKRVLCGASLRADGSSVALTGGSGSGKTTLLRILAGLETADGGDVITTGKTAFVFAEPRLFDVSVLENVVCVMDKNVPKTENERRACEILESLGLSDASKLRLRELSSGMAARVSVARAIAYNADNYLLDEPFRALDEKTADMVKKYVFSALRGKSVIMVTHENFDVKLCDMHVHIEDGKVVTM